MSQPTNAATAADRLREFLRGNTEAAFDIAYAALEGLYIDEDDGETMLMSDDSYPRGSGSDYVDHVGEAITSVPGLNLIIDNLQAEAEAAFEAEEGAE